MKCPRQSAFVECLDELLLLHKEVMKDRFSVDEHDEFCSQFTKKKKWFVNFWCPTFKEYEEF